MLLGKVCWIFGSDGHFKWLVQCWYLQYLWSQAVKTSVNSVLVSSPVCSLITSLIPNSCYPLDKLEVKLETGIRFKLGANWLFWNLDRWLSFTFMVSGLVTVHTTQKCRVEHGIGAFLSFTRYFSSVQSFTLSCVLPKHQSYTLKMKELSQNCNQKFLNFWNQVHSSYPDLEVSFFWATEISSLLKNWAGSFFCENHSLFGYNFCSENENQFGSIWIFLVVGGSGGVLTITFA